jgi:hypothetical protein
VSKGSGDGKPLTDLPDSNNRHLFRTDGPSLDLAARSKISVVAHQLHSAIGDLKSEILRGVLAQLVERLAEQEKILDEREGR